MNPTTSLSMIYLREFERTNSSVPGRVRLARKAGHLLRMHWQYVASRHVKAPESAAERPDTVERPDLHGRLLRDLSGAGGL